MNAPPPRPSPRRTILLACTLSLMAHGVIFGVLKQWRAPQFSQGESKLFLVKLAEDARPKKPTPTPTPAVVPTPLSVKTPPQGTPVLRGKNSVPPTSHAQNQVPSRPHSKTSARENGSRRSRWPGGIFPSTPGELPADNTPRLPSASGEFAPRSTPNSADSETVQPGTAARPLAVGFRENGSQIKPIRTPEPSEATPDGNEAPEPLKPRGTRKIRRSEEPEATPPPRPAPVPNPEPNPQPEIRPQAVPAVEEFHRPRAISEPKPDYPDVARDRNQQGNVQMRLEINANGAVTSVTVTQSSGHAALDEAAQRAAKRWKYQPARRGETPVASSITRTLKWTLED